MPGDTRERILAATSELFRRHGMIGTGLKQIAGAADAPFGSIYHFFPGGKSQLAEEVIRTSGRAYGELVISIFTASPDFSTGVRTAFATAAQLLEATDYVEACPIATIALEVASVDEALRIATRDVFTGWIDAGVDMFDGFEDPPPPEVRRELMIAFIVALEGAFILARSMRSTEPLFTAMRTVLAAAG